MLKFVFLLLTVFFSVYYCQEVNCNSYDNPCTIKACREVCNPCQDECTVQEIYPEIFSCTEPAKVMDAFDACPGGISRQSATPGSPDSPPPPPSSASALLYSFALLSFVLIFITF
eukprot:TRINITY_DN18106_c0_g1_i1.p1 TRINITY_DN18106_c0_g1~~TRINITY_DN18106_c0_g1_i1.p1  ORF type:complete len:122 (+),score=13.10 TRINITY_DN18106_c0_g1_i1:24-368(+)